MIIIKTANFDKKILENNAFRMWFGNSKVVDEKGNPLVVYKGMYPYDYTKEDKSKNYKGEEIEVIGRNSNFPSFDPSDQEPVRIAGFFTDDPGTAERFVQDSGAIFPVYLRIVNPKIIDGSGQKLGNIQFGKEGRPFRDAIRSGKYDGVFIKNTVDEGNIYIALHSNQIKSAIGNSGNYNGSDLRITASRSHY